MDFSNFKGATNFNDNNKGGNNNFGFANAGGNNTTPKEPKTKREIRIIKGSPASGKSTVLILTKTEEKNIIFQMAKQQGTTQDKNGRQLPKFNYDNKIYFSLSDAEAGQILVSLNKIYLTGQPEKLQFPHQTAKEPKNIDFSFSVYNNKIQCSVAVYVKNNQEKNVSIFLSDAELEILRHNLIAQITL